MGYKFIRPGGDFLLLKDGEIDDPYRSFISKSRYSRWLEDEGRRETWQETVDRYVGYMRKHAPEISRAEWKKIRKAILNHEVMPSMRALMTAGPALDRDNLALFNCSFVAVDDPRVFDEALYILMNGTGLGFSVEAQHIDKLPPVPASLKPVNKLIVVEDSKIGWAEAYQSLIEHLYAGEIPFFDTTKVRPAGARLKTFGGRASGPEPLISLFDFTIEKFMRASGRRLTPLEVHDVMCKIGEVVVVGGVRRCFVDNTEIPTDRGNIFGKDISVGDIIVSGGRKARVSAKIDSGKQMTVIVKHQFGQSEMTPNHRIAVFNTVNSYEFKEAGSLEPGDRLVWDLAGYDGEIQSLPDSMYAGHFNSKPFNVPEVLDTDVAWLIGLVQGDGHIHVKGVEISGHIDEWATLERANAIFADKFGVPGKVSNDSHDGNGIRLRINSTGLALWFAENIKTPNASIRIPEFIKFAQRDIRAAYLAGVLDSDGRVRSDGLIDQATTIYSEFASDLVSLLRGIGIPAHNKFSSAQRRRNNGENAQDFWTVSVATRTGSDMYFSLVSVYSERNLPVRTKNTGDFSYPAQWNLSYRNRATTRQWAIDNNILDVKYQFAPVRLESVEIGSVQQTWDIEVENIHEFTADGLITHNSALISLSDLDSFEMSKAKSGAWWTTDPQRTLANNSAVYNDKPSVGEFLREWGGLYDSKSGERGIFNKRQAISQNTRRDTSKIVGTNPCGEILLRNAGLCNLTEVIVRPEDTVDTLKEKVRTATILGTVQARFTDFKHIRPIWKENAESERLLGVSMTGQLGNKLMSGQLGKRELKNALSTLKTEAISTNVAYAVMLGINPSAAITTVKPSGTVSQLTYSAAGMHPWHSKFWLRTVRGDNKDPVTKFLKDMGIPAEPDVMHPETSTVFTFPQRAPEGAFIRDDLSAIEHLDIWLMYKLYWTEHNPSVTISVKEDEWIEVANWVYSHWDQVGGLSFLPHSDHVYKQAPYQECDEATYNQFAADMPKDIDWDMLKYYEQEDNTSGSQTLSCTANSCEITQI